jgi:NADP-dependent 3-hydroxy acid dehydrogenase YdfG
MSDEQPVAVVTGASSGIGEATARQLAAAGFDLVVGARRIDRLESLASEIGGRAMRLDVTDSASVSQFTDSIARVNVLVNNAGGAFGLEEIAEAEEENWRAMWETNVLGLMLVTRALLGKLEASGAGHVVNVGSISGFEVYRGGAGYTSVKHAARAVTRTLRLELLGKPVRVTEIDPGAVETEFSLVRLGSAEAARRVYEGYQPLVADDIADAIVWSVTRPPHVNIDEIVIRPVAQAAATVIHRQSNR